MFRFMSEKRILCVVRYFAGEQRTIRLVFSVALRCVFFFHLFLRVACIRACSFLLFFVFHSYCFRELHPVMKNNTLYIYITL